MTRDSTTSSGDPERYAHLWRNLARSNEAPPPTLEQWTTLPSPDALPDPWSAWMLLCLVRRRRRQLWVREVVVHHLGADLQALSTRGSFGHPDRPQCGPVPGHLEWEYFFHGRGCRLTHRVSGESIDVDFHDGDAEHFDLFFYQNDLRTLRTLGPPETRLCELHPRLRPLELAQDELIAAGVLVQHPDRGVPRLAPSVITREPLVAPYDREVKDPRTFMWRMALINDWLAVASCPAVHELPGLSALAQERTAALKAQRESRLLALIDLGDPYGVALRALADLPSAKLPGVLQQTLRGPINGAISAALELIASREDPELWCPHVLKLWTRLSPNAGAPQPHIWESCASFLLHHQYRTALVARELARAGPGCVGEAAILALEFAPRRALPLFRRALRSQVPISRTRAAAALGVIDKPWSRRELQAVLAKSRDHELTAAARAALAESRDPAAREAVLAWERRYPHEPEPGPFITMREVMLRDAGRWMQDEMDGLRERVVPLVDQRVE